MKFIAETERLIIREILPTDVDGMSALHADPDVHVYLGNKIITTKKGIVDLIDFVRQQYREHGVGRWAVIVKRTNEFAGWTGLELVTKKTNGHKNYYDLGYRLLKRFWGQGIATESAVASLEYGFDKLKASEVFGMADCRNDASNKILKKVGLKFIETFAHEGTEHNWYRIGRTEYEDKPGTLTKS